MLLIPGTETPLVVDIPAQNISKSTGDATNILKPYDFSATFDTVIPDVEIQPGWNTVRVLAQNYHGLTGYADRGFEVKADAPPDTIIQTTIQVYNDAGGSSIMMFLGVDAWMGCKFYNEVEPGVYHDVETDGQGQPLGTLIVLNEDGFAVDPDSVDSFAIHLTQNHPDGLFNIEQVIWIEETDDASRVFEGEAVVEEVERETWQDYTLNLESLSPIYESTGGLFEPFVMRVMGPEGIRDVLSEISFTSDAGEQTFAIVEWNGDLVLGDGMTQQVEVMLAIPVEEDSYWNTLTEGNLAEKFEAAVTYQLSFQHGFGVGLWDSLVDIVTGIGDLFQALWYIGVNYNSIAVIERQFSSGTLLLEADRSAN